MNTNLLEAAYRFHDLADTASRNGGLWVSASGGTANVAAGILSRCLGVTYEAAHAALNMTGRPGWYGRLADSQPWRWDQIPPDDEIRWGIETIAKAAVRPWC